jgi:hypothetical protein
MPNMMRTLMAEVTYVERGVEVWTREVLGGEQPELAPLVAGGDRGAR